MVEQSADPDEVRDQIVFQPKAVQLGKGRHRFPSKKRFADLDEEPDLD